MKIIISPAKSLDFETKANTSLFTKPAFLNQSEKLNKKLKTTSRKRLSELMSISAALADLNYERNQAWYANYDENEGKQAVFAFTGEVYRGLDINTLDTKNLSYIQENLRIVSGLYGILKPLDIILPYRLEMGTKLKVGRTADLYQFWGNQLSQFLNDEMQADEILVNLASTEYSKAVLNKNLKAKVITPIFKELKGNQYKVVMTYAKNARGLMVRYMADNKVTTIDEIKGFNLDGYGFSEKLSSANELVFVR